MRRKYQIYLLNVIIAMLVGVFIFSMYHLVRITYFKESSKKVNDRIIKEVMIPKGDSSEDDKEVGEFKIDFARLKEINSDVIGWIYIPGTKINYPIVQRKDNWYYLNHDIYKKYNIMGSIFMNARNQSDFSDSNTILFGHNNHQDHLMFTDLKEIYDGTLGDELSIYIYTENKTYTYQIYSVYLTSPSDETPLNIETNFFERAEKEFLHVKSDSMKTLTLSTCYKDSSQRIIVHASRNV